MRLDPEVKAVSKESIVAIAKVTEYFVNYFSKRCAHTVALRGAKSITMTDLLHTIHTNDNLDFLRMDYPRQPRISKATTDDATAQANKNRVNRPLYVANAAAPFKTNTIDSFFKNSNNVKNAIEKNDIDDHIIPISTENNSNQNNFENNMENNVVSESNMDDNIEDQVADNVENDNIDDIVDVVDNNNYENENVDIMDDSAPDAAIISIENEGIDLVSDII
jgi:hypothetical protein